MFFDNAKDRQELIKELFAGLLKSAGKGKNEVISVLGREMGLAFAAMVKEPLQKIVDSKAVNINFKIELVDKDKASTGTKKRPSAKRASATKKKTTRD
jgi:hypothetical protein